MSNETEIQADPATPAKRPLISLPFLIIVGVLAVAAYLAGPKVMEFVMLQQESAKANKNPEAPENFKIRPEGLEFAFSSGAAGPATGDSSGGGGGGMDPEAIFAERDADGNGKIEGDEISGRMADRLDSIDTDGDGSVSKEEFVEAVKNRRGGRGGDNEEPTDGEDAAESGDDN